MAVAETPTKNKTAIEAEPITGPVIKPTKKNRKTSFARLADNKFTNSLRNQVQDDATSEEQEYAEQQEAELQAAQLSQQQMRQPTEPPPIPYWAMEAGEPSANQQITQTINTEEGVDHEDQEEQLQGEQENEKNMSALAARQFPGGQMPGISGLSADSASDLLKQQAKNKIKMWILSALLSASPYILIGMLLILIGTFIAVPTYCAYQRGTAANAWSASIGWISGEGAWTKVINDALAGCIAPSSGAGAAVANETTPATKAPATKTTGSPAP